MDQDTTILVAVVTAVFAGVAGLVKLMLPYIAKRRSDPPAAMAATVTTTIANPPAADGTGPHAAVDVSRSTPEPAPWEQFTKTLHDVQSKVDSIDPALFATKHDVEALSTTMKEDIEDLEDRVDKNAEKTQRHLTSLERAIGRLEGKLDK